MKKAISLLMVVLIFLSSMNLAYAEEIRGGIYDDFKWVVLNDGTVKIVDNDLSTFQSEHLIIPDKIDDCTVSEIEDLGYDWGNKITTITIPKTVNKIGDHAFIGFKKLESITIPESVKTIGDSLFTSPESVNAIVSKDSYAEEYCKINGIPYTYSSKIPFAYSIKEWTKSDIIQMSNYMNMGLVFQTGKWILSQGIFDKNNAFRLESYNSLSGESALISQKNPYYINNDGLWIVYTVKDEESQSINKGYVTGGSEQTLIELKDLQIGRDFNSLQVYDGYIYFSVVDESTQPIIGQFLRADLDGQNITTILDKAVYFPYIIDNKVYYQDDADKNRLHVCNLDGSDDQVFIDDQCYQFIYDGMSFYYNSFDKEVEFDDNGIIANASDLTTVLKKYTPGEEIEVLKDVHPTGIAFNGETVFYTNSFDADRLYSYDKKTGSIEPLYLNDYLANINFVDESFVFAWDIDYDDNGEIEDVGLVLANTDGSGILSLVSLSEQ